MAAGFTVNVREIPIDYPAPKKEDPDSWIVDKAHFQQMKEEGISEEERKKSTGSAAEDIGQQLMISSR